jgi:hypothetical protein
MLAFKNIGAAIVSEDVPILFILDSILLLLVLEHWENANELAKIKSTIGTSFIIRNFLVFDKYFSNYKYGK